MSEKQAFKIKQTAQERAEINRNSYSHQGYSPGKSSLSCWVLSH